MYKRQSQYSGTEIKRSFREKLDIIGESIGGGRINIAQIDGIETNFSGENPTLIVHNQDQPGHVAEVTSMLAQKKINIATLQLYRSGKGGRAVMVVECDQDAVSYTHLDVYKRQVLCCSDSNLLGSYSL